MPKLIRFLPIALYCTICLLFTGCSTPTIMRLSGTEGASFSGHYRSKNSSFDVSGAVPLVIEVAGATLQECKFLKSDPQSTLTLEIRRDNTQFVRCTAEPGALGLRAQDDGGWSFQIIR